MSDCTVLPVEKLRTFHLRVARHFRDQSLPSGSDCNASLFSLHWVEMPIKSGQLLVLSHRTTRNLRNDQWLGRKRQFYYKLGRLNSTQQGQKLEPNIQMNGGSKNWQKTLRFIKLASQHSRVQYFELIVLECSIIQETIRKEFMLCAFIINVAPLSQ